MNIRKKFAYILVITACFGGASSSLAQSIDPATADGFVKINRKIQCSLEDNYEVVYRWSGRGYSRVPGEPDKHLFNLEGMNVRQCVAVTDKLRGVGFKMVSREIMLYLDPITGELMDTWTNPWTGDQKATIHVANDPVNSREPTFGKTKQGKTIPFDLVDINGTYLWAIEVPLFYTNPLAGDYQKYVGGTYHATEIFDFNGSTKELLDSQQDIAYPAVSWVRIAKWLPWMQMGDRTGLLYFNAIGKKLESYDQLPKIIKDTIATRYPAYRHAPPTDDTRPNETSWTYMKKIIDSRTAEPK